MATESGNASPAVTLQATSSDAKPELANLRRMLEEEPFRVHFFQAVRLLQKMETGLKPVGYFITPQGETIRFSSRTSLSFPPSEIHELHREEGGQTKMTVEFRGWEKYRFFIEYERTREDRLSGHLLDLLGLGTEGLRSRGGIPDDAYLNYVALLARHVRSAASLKQILEDYFGVDVHIQQFAGAWRKLSTENQTSFSGFGGPSERLGVGVVAGDEVWDHHGRIRIALGPMPFQQYLKFLPGQEAYRELVAWLRFYSNGSYETEVQLVLAREDAPACELGSGGAMRPQLGLVSWLKTKPLNRDPADATYLVQ